MPGYDKKWKRPPRRNAVKISYLPGFGPEPEPDLTPKTKFPFVATINGRRAIVWPDWIEYEEE